VPKRCTLIIVINKCCTLSVSFYLSMWIFGIVETGIARGSLLGLPPRCRESGFRPRKSGSFQRQSHVSKTTFSLQDGEQDSSIK
jgi:hypothetical protein